MAVRQNDALATEPDLNTSIQLQPAAPTAPAWNNRFEIIAAIMLSIATVLSAWSAYQATRWGGVQTVLFSEASAARVQAAQASGRANALQAIDVTVFAQYAEAVSTENTLLSDFFYNRFRPEMKVAVDAWLATKPLQNADAPPSPFAMPDYKLAAATESQEFTALAEQKSNEAKDANQRGDNYILLTVMFASVLFFAGITSKFESLHIKSILLVLGALILLGAIVIMATYPIY